MASSINTFVDVILPVALPNLYTYHVRSETKSDAITPGMRVSVQFGKRKLFTAMVVKVHSTKPEAYATKPILALLDEKPVVFEWQIQLWQWIADYYLCTIGEVYTAALPNGLRPEGQTRIYLSELPEEGIELSAMEENIYNLLSQNPGITIEKLNPLTENKQVMPVLKKLIDRGIITFEESLKDKHKPKLVNYISLHDELKPEAALNE
ncbi:MAG TPA: primosomal protein N', partial [Bacteroidales bacterium]|nr:primosomal protein N' [Bacteroidales bacterium]